MYQSTSSTPGESVAWLMVAISLAFLLILMTALIASAVSGGSDDPAPATTEQSG